MPADAKAAPVSPNPEPASSLKAEPPCSRQEAPIRVAAHTPGPHAEGRTAGQQSQVHHRHHRKAPAGASHADVPRLHQLNAVPLPEPSRGPCSRPSPSARHLVPNPLPFPARVGLSAGPHAAAARPDNKASHAPYTVQHRTLTSTDAQTPQQAQPALGPPAALPIAGPSRGGGRTRGEAPSRALPRRAAARERRHQTFANGTGRAAGHVSVGLSAAALAVVLSVRRLTNSFRRAWRGFRAGRSPNVWPAGESHRQGRNAGPHAAASRPDKNVFHAPGTIRQRPPLSTDAQTP